MDAGTQGLDSLKQRLHRGPEPPFFERSRYAVMSSAPKSAGAVKSIVGGGGGGGGFDFQPIVEC